ncbi:MAG: hypothetical protein M3Q15_03995 [Pseudomonadota bacterium]|nr:hypothetical protein [Pseudomonadota bacterium]
MIKPILMISALALAAPAFAQSVTGGSGPPMEGGKSATPAEVAATGDDTVDNTPDNMSMSTGTRYSSNTGYTMRNWNWSGDMGTIGATDYGANRGMMSAGTTTSASSGMGGPLDIDGQWSSYASAGSMELTPLEFGVWMLEANGHDLDAQVAASRRSRAANLPAVQVLNLTSGALAQADTNRNWRVSREELMRFTG